MKPPKKDSKGNITPKGGSMVIEAMSFFKTAL